ETAKAFCAWLSEREGLVYRLPTDHEWSCAAGIGSQEDPSMPPSKKKNLSPSINELEAAAMGNVRRSGHGRAMEVGSFPPNQNGLYDMIGNLWELVDTKYNDNSDAGTLRGLAFNNFGGYLRLSQRESTLPKRFPMPRTFRVVIDP
ncbi:MAG: SUMF1/EgtB/PvdO family nonheme iron enzyme, partial [Verrucomicrobiota bacterium]